MSDQKELSPEMIAALIQNAIGCGKVTPPVENFPGYMFNIESEQQAKQIMELLHKATGKKPAGDDGLVADLDVVETYAYRLIKEDKFFFIADAAIDVTRKGELKILGKPLDKIQKEFAGANIAFPKDPPPVKMEEEKEYIPMPGLGEDIVQTRLPNVKQPTDGKIKLG